MSKLAIQESCGSQVKTQDGSKCQLRATGRLISLQITCYVSKLAGQSQIGSPSTSTPRCTDCIEELAKSMRQGRHCPLAERLQDICVHQVQLARSFQVVCDASAGPASPLSAAIQKLHAQQARLTSETAKYSISGGPAVVRRLLHMSFSGRIFPSSPAHLPTPTEREKIEE